MLLFNSLHDTIPQIFKVAHHERRSPITIFKGIPETNSLINSNEFLQNSDSTNTNKLPNRKLADTVWLRVVCAKQNRRQLKIFINLLYTSKCL